MLGQCSILLQYFYIIGSIGLFESDDVCSTIPYARAYGIEIGSKYDKPAHLTCSTSTRERESNRTGGCRGNGLCSTTVDYMRDGYLVVVPL